MRPPPGRAFGRFFAIALFAGSFLGGNVFLLVDPAWSVVLNMHFLRGRGSFSKPERWQTN